MLRLLGRGRGIGRGMGIRVGLWVIRMMVGRWVCCISYASSYVEFRVGKIADVIS